MDLQVTTPRLKRESLLEDWENKLSEFLDQNSDSDLVQIEEVFFLKKKKKKKHLFLPIQDLSAAQFVLVTGSIIK